MHQEQSYEVLGWPAWGCQQLKHVPKPMLLSHQVTSIARWLVSLVSSGQITGMLESAVNKRA
jgi:hypothetical protein